LHFAIHRPSIEPFSAWSAKESSPHPAARVKHLPGIKIVLPAFPDVDPVN
jgi:hypothetical protein